MIQFQRYFKPTLQVLLGSQTLPTGYSGALSLLPFVEAVNEDATFLEYREGKGLKMVFRVQKSLSPLPNTADLSIYNLAPETVKKFSSRISNAASPAIGIAAGYDSVAGSIFTGQIRSMSDPILQGADLVYHFKCNDAGDVIDDVSISISIPIVDPAKLIDVVLLLFEQEKKVVIKKHPSVDIVLADAPNRSSFSTAVVHIGKASDLLSEVARVLQARWWIQDGELYMTKLGIPTDGQAIFLDRGRLLAPISEDSNGFAQITTFCDPNIIPGRQIQVRLDPLRRGSQTSVYRVSSVEYTGDTFGGSPWMCYAQCWRTGLTTGGLT